MRWTLLMFALLLAPTAASAQCTGTFPPNTVCGTVGGGIPDAIPNTGTVASVANGDGTLTVSPTTGAVVASLALGHANVWSAVQSFNANTLVLGGVTGSTQCLQATTAGVVTGTGTPCGSSGGAVGSVTNADGTLTITPTTGAVVASLALSHSNTWSAAQHFNANTLVLAGLTGVTQCLQASPTGVVTGTGTVCDIAAGTVTSVNIAAGTNMSIGGTCNSTTAIGCTLSLSSSPTVSGLTVTSGFVANGLVTTAAFANGVTGSGAIVLQNSPVLGGFTTVGDIVYTAAPGVATNYYVCIDAGSSWVMTYSNSCSVSDRRMKNFDSAFDPALGLHDVMLLKPVNFHFKDIHQPGEQIGFFAQDVERILPQLVTTGKAQTITLANGEQQTINDVESLDYAKLVVPLVAAVQALSKKVETLEHQLNQRSARVHHSYPRRKYAGGQ